MKNQNNQELIAEWLQLQKDDPHYEILRLQLLNSGVSHEELAELEELNKALKQLPEQQPSSHMSEQFYARLAGEQFRVQDRFRLWKQIHAFFNLKHLLKPALVFSYSLLLVMAGWWLGKGNLPMVKLEGDLAEMKQMMTFTMLNQSTSTERIRAIQFISAMNGWDSKTYSVLFDIINDDSNMNVRLVALDALLNRADQTLVREGLINALQRQNAPLMQLTITDALLRHREKKALPQFRRMLLKKDLNYRVRSRLVEAIRIFT